MKHKLLPFALFFILVVSSCGIQKRLYRPGFYIPGRAVAGSSEKASQESTDTAAATAAMPEEKSAESAVMITESATEDIKEESSPVEKLIAAKKETEGKIFRGIAHTRKAVRETKGMAMDEDNALLLIGFGVLVAGCLIFWGGYTLQAANPVPANVIMILGAVVFVCGIIIMAMGYPKILDSFLEALFN